MSWHIKSTGTIADIQAALNALVVDDEIEAQQFATVKEVFNNSVGQGSTTPDVVVPNTFLYGVTNAEDSKLQLIASGRMDGRVSWVNYNLSVVKLIPQNAIVGTVHPIPFDTTTITQGGGGGGADLFLFDSGDTFTFSSTALTSLTVPLWMTDVPFVTISLPNLATSTNYIDIDTCPDLESVDLSSLVSCGDGTSGLYLTSCNSLPSISLPSLVTVDGELYFQTSAALVSFSAPSLVTINGDVTADTNPLLTTVTLTSWLPTNGTTIGLDGNALNLASVNHILARCVANAAFVSGSVLLNGGTNAAPAGQGATDVTTLTGRGVTVNTN